MRSGLLLEREEKTAEDILDISGSCLALEKEAVVDLRPGPASAFEARWIGTWLGICQLCLVQCFLAHL